MHKEKEESHGVRGQPEKEDDEQAPPWPAPVSRDEARSPAAPRLPRLSPGCDALPAATSSRTMGKGGEGARK